MLTKKEVKKLYKKFNKLFKKPNKLMAKTLAKMEIIMAEGTPIPDSDFDNAYDSWMMIFLRKKLIKND